MRKELNKQKAELQEIDEKIDTLGRRMDKLLDFLNTHGALEEYVALTKQLTTMQNELNRIHEYQRFLKTYKDTVLDIKENLIRQDRETQQYLEDAGEYFV
ncbi:MAG: hypothetical protein V8S58_01660 [Lachnospiraceae bacterium]